MTSVFDDVDVSSFPPGNPSLSEHQRYEHPLVQRYATKEMSSILSPAMKFTTWRKLWLALASSQRELGLQISEEQLGQMKEHLYDIDFDRADEYEKKFRHDVMGHVHAYGDVAPLAMPILHLGATSCYVGDNADIIVMREGLKLIKTKLVKTLDVLAKFADKYKDVPTLGFTHYQPAQLTTVGKRASLWMQDLLLDYDRVNHELDNLVMRGVKGTTGTQASFLELFDGDHAKVKRLNELVCEKLGFVDETTGKVKCIAVSGQTYTRKIDYYVLSALSGIAQSAYKMCGDIRLLANLKEVEEPFESNQVGSSAMPYKRNPMRSERVCSLSRYVMSLPANAAHTHAGQWFERTLDDSAIRRIVIPEGFLAVDVILNLLMNIGDGMVVWEKVVERHVMEELPFMATEVILMECEYIGCIIPLPGHVFSFGRVLLVPIRAFRPHLNGMPPPLSCPLRNHRYLSRPPRCQGWRRSSGASRGDTRPLHGRRICRQGTGKVERLARADRIGSAIRSRSR